MEAILLSKGVSEDRFTKGGLYHIKEDWPLITHELPEDRPLGLEACVYGGCAQVSAAHQLSVVFASRVRSCQKEAQPWTRHMHVSVGDRGDLISSC